MSITSVDRGSTAEFELLGLCVRQSPTPSQISEIRQALKSAIDWASFLALANRHRIVPHVYQVLSQCVDGLVPEQALQAIKASYAQIKRHNLIRVAEMARAANRLDSLGVPMLGFKGPALAVEAYGGLDRRQYRDVDILIPQDKIHIAAEAFVAMGYEGPGAGIPAMSDRQRRQLLRTRKDVKFYKRVGDVTVLFEVHWKLSFSFRFDEQRIWNSDNCLRIGTSAIQSLPPAELLCYLAYHGATHRWARLSWLADLLQAYEMQPESARDEFFQLATELSVERHVLLGFLVLCRLGLIDELPAAAARLQARHKKIGDLVPVILAAMHENAEGHMRPDRVAPWLYRLTGRIHPAMQMATMSLRPGAEELSERGVLNAQWHRCVNLVKKYGPKRKLVS